MVGPTGSASTTGKQSPSTVGTDYNAETFSDADESQSVFDLETQSGSIIVRAHPDNDGIVYLGWDEEVTTENGFPLEAGDAITVDINVGSQGLFGVADTDGDELRYMAVE